MEDKKENKASLRKPPQEISTNYPITPRIKEKEKKGNERKAERRKRKYSPPNTPRGTFVNFFFSNTLEFKQRKEKKEKRKKEGGGRNRPIEQKKTRSRRKNDSSKENDPKPKGKKEWKKRKDSRKEIRRKR